jgi:enoyl-CoA hydratase/carnithine racemase
MSGTFFHLDLKDGVRVLRLESGDGTNLLSHVCVMSLQAAFKDMRAEGQPLVLTGNEKFFLAGADLYEIVALDGPRAYEFSKMGQELIFGESLICGQQ